MLYWDFIAYIFFINRTKSKFVTKRIATKIYHKKQFNIFSVWLHLIHLQSSFMREQRLSLYILIWFLCFLRWLPSNELLEARPKPLGMKVVWKTTLCIMLLRQELLFLRLTMITNHKTQYKSHTKMFFGPTILIITAIYDSVRKKAVTITYWYISIKNKNVVNVIISMEYVNWSLYYYDLKESPNN